MTSKGILYAVVIVITSFFLYICPARNKTTLTIVNNNNKTITREQGGVNILMSGSKGLNAVCACTKRHLTLRPAKHEKVAVSYGNARISNVLGLRELRSNEAIRRHHSHYTEPPTSSYAFSVYRHAG